MYSQKVQAERAWLAWVRRQAERTAPGRRELRLGIGDDAALVRPGAGWEVAITTDLLVEDVHFLRRRDPAAACGRRLATRALSDLAAMGAEPLALLLSTAFPFSLPNTWPRLFYRGLLAAADEAGAGLIGGDAATAPGGKIVLDVVGLGQLPAGKALIRAGAKPGDRIFVSGVLGEAARGRQLVHRGLRAGSAADRRARARHLHPQARWELGRMLRGRATAAIDLSDGLAVDLHHLCRESRVGADIRADSLPRLTGARGLDLALYGGEDYELLFTLPPGVAPPRGFDDLTEIGSMRAGSGVRLLGRDGRPTRLAAAGWQHWS